jgi:hypothetical protein
MQVDRKEPHVDEFTALPMIHGMQQMNRYVQLRNVDQAYWMAIEGLINENMKWKMFEWSQIDGRGCHLNQSPSTCESRD